MDQEQYNDAREYLLNFLNYIETKLQITYGDYYPNHQFYVEAADAIEEIRTKVDTHLSS